jgi:hypothetical protein
MGTQVESRVEGSVAWMQLDGATQLNAVGTATYTQLAAAMHAPEQRDSLPNESGYSKETEEFRAEVRKFIAAKLPLESESLGSLDTEAAAPPPANKPAPNASTTNDDATPPP